MQAAMKMHALVRVSLLSLLSKSTFHTTVMSNQEKLLNKTTTEDINLNCDVIITKNSEELNMLEV